ncbi:phosphonate ABC transporter ATP-binding protein [Crenobacter intestini]|uniref:ATP-binding cassette domain-containing protein n=1 Tax=Crenobacter intestini TaxID=2563443 RepID=A0A4T0V1C1_9NEIS|nr:ATP-binding cassette domain-containing protein [Crenobacter intestini]TIC85352.1 ATP-binding cassette domain-containing protein [Crenobacter intestini]
MSLTLAAASLTRGKRRLLDGISLTLAQGEQAALIGPSGAGKSSLISLAATLAAPDGGQVSLLGEAPWQLGARARRALRARIACVWQSPPLPARQRVIHAVAAGRLGQTGTLAALARLMLPRDGSAIERTLARVELAHKLWARSDVLSGGERQRVGVARALYQAGELVLADEPVSALDPYLAAQTVRVLCEDARARGATLLMSLHSVELALAHFPRIIALRDGRVAFDLPASEVDEARLAALYEGDSPAGPALSSPATALTPARC